MSSILLSNPFPASQPPSSMALDISEGAGPLAPVQTSASTATANNSQGFNGAGTGGRSPENTVALFQSYSANKWERPANATSGSVIDAQAEQQEEVLPFGTNLPKVEMPNPLPTSPFLKGAEETP